MFEVRGIVVGIWGGEKARGMERGDREQSKDRKRRLFMFWRVGRVKGRGAGPGGVYDWKE